MENNEAEEGEIISLDSNDKSERKAVEEEDAGLSVRGREEATMFNIEEMKQAKGRFRWKINT